MRLRRLLSLCLAVAGLVACQRGQDGAVPVTADTAVSEGSGAVSTAAPATPVPAPLDLSRTTDWPAATVETGQVQVSCSPDYADQGDGLPLQALDFAAVQQALAPCQEAGVVRVRYSGKINGEFTSVVERVANMAQRLAIPKRILDLDSTGGQVEDAMRAGDVIAESHWTVWVRERSICHSACVLILAAGDARMISGKVGVHRMIRIGSAATSRGELTEELKAVQAQMHDYLQRNGASVAVADLMMTVPNRRLRLLDPNELKEFGLDGTNAVQDDLDRIRLARDCGEGFVERRDNFIRAFDRRCLSPGAAMEDINTCGLALRGDYGFPDSRCPSESPLSEHDAPRLAQTPPLAVPGNSGGGG